MKKTVSSFIVFYLLWVILAGIEPWELLLGGGISLILAVLVGPLVPYVLTGRSLVQVVKYIVLFVPLFVWKLVVANVQMAKLVLTPSLPIKPGFIVVKTGLQGDLAKLSLANAITLTPGTLSVDVKEDEVLIHWVTVKGETASEHRNEISKAFEKTLGGIFE